MLQALYGVRNQGGIAVIVGNAIYGEHLQLDPRQLNQGKQLRGTWGGDNIPDRDFPHYMDLIITKNLNIDFKIGDAHYLPFENNSFDVVIAECVVCALNKEMAIAEMIRVLIPGGFIGIHDICWKEDTPNDLKVRLKAIENESPETLVGWKKLFSDNGLENCSVTDKSHLMSVWMESNKKNLGFTGQLRIGMKVFQKWGIKGVKTILESERIFKSPYTGYGIIVGRKPIKD